MSHLDHIRQHITASIHVKQQLLDDTVLLQTVADLTERIIDCYHQGGKLLFCGNGGSAADAQHLAAEFSGKLYKDRDPLNAEALHVNTSYLTAVANDYSFDEVYSRLVQAKGKSGDILFAISTSGESKNIIRAAQKAKELGLIVVAMTGQHGGQLKIYADVWINVPAADTQRIQEAHILIGHIICQLVEENYFA
jgi:D-sedoheptulose 7-phosphate isomerase